MSFARRRKSPADDSSAQSLGQQQQGFLSPTEPTIEFLYWNSGDDTRFEQLSVALGAKAVLAGWRAASTDELAKGQTTLPWCLSEPNLRDRQALDGTAPFSGSTNA
jgi:hypothetical protein